MKCFKCEDRGFVCIPDGPDDVTKEPCACSWDKEDCKEKSMMDLIEELKVTVDNMKEQLVVKDAR